ncbi:MAG: prenyltransferase/squalene oxidase repeat-containing protein [Planctomycetota bacterium]|nr:prenyltransferase/squalene oxidase repeat-containing protein [Planctomycetota bacterium]
MRRHQHTSLRLLLVLILATLAGCHNVDSQVLPRDVAPAAHIEVVDGQRQGPLVKSCRWLWDQQAQDGGWHSQHYGLLKSGQAYTPFVLHTLLEIPESVFPRPAGAVERALEFIRTHTSEEGVIGISDPDVLEYPNYSTAYALLCFLQTDPTDPLVGRMAEYLKKQQYREGRGFPEDHPAHGGWGFGGSLPDGQPGHMDLAHTRRVLQALHAAGSLDHDTSEAAQRFLRLVQRHPTCRRSQPQLDPDHPYSDAVAPYDGGFYFSPVVLAANKGRTELETEQPYLRSYASATCDGLLSLLAVGAGSDDERSERAIGWLAIHPRIDYPAGVPIDHPEPWGEAVHYYHLAVRAEANRAVHVKGDWGQEIRDHLADLQKEDGHFVNQVSPLMKEDDPLLATSLAVIALAHSRQQGDQ